MAKVIYVFRDPADFVAAMHAKFAALASHALAGKALTDDPPAVPMSGGQGPAGAAKPSTCQADGCERAVVCGVRFGPFIAWACREHGMEGAALARRLDPLLDALTKAYE